MLDIYIQYKTNYNYSSTLGIVKYEDNNYEFFYYKSANKLYICRYNNNGSTITHEYKFTELHFNNDDLWEPFAFQQNTVLDIDFDFFREILIEIQKFSDYIDLNILTLPQI